VASATRTPRTWAVLPVALIWGALSGLGLDLLTVFVAAHGPEGPGWSLKGNGALIIPFGFGPSLLAGDWTARVLRAHGRLHPERARAAVFAAGVVLVLVDLPVITLFRGQALAIMNTLVTWAVFTLPVLAPLVAWMSVKSRSGRRVGWHFTAAAIYTVALAVSFYSFSYGGELLMGDVIHRAAGE